MAELGGDDLVQSPLAVNMKVICPSQQVHRKNEPHKAKVMITVQVTDEDVIDPVQVGLETHELHLGTFAAIDQEVPVLYLNQLR